MLKVHFFYHNTTHAAPILCVWIFLFRVYCALYIEHVLEVIEQYIGFDFCEKHLIVADKIIEM